MNRSRVLCTAIFVLIINHYAFGIRQYFACLVDADGVVELQIDGFRMPDAHRDPDRGGRNENALISHDLPSFPDHLPFLFAIPFLACLPIVRQDIAGKLGSMGLCRWNGLAAAERANLGI